MVRLQRQSGLTLLELMVVLAIIAIATAGVSLALRDNSQARLEQDAQRLVAHLEAARVHARTSGKTLVWQPTTTGFVIETWPRAASQTVQTVTWLQEGVQAQFETGASQATDAGVVLGPEPILLPTRIVLSLATQRSTAFDSSLSHSLRIGTDGLRPFEVLP